MLEEIGYHPRMARWACGDDASIVRVAGMDHGVAAVLTGRGPSRASLDGALLARMAADDRAGPCPGDWCVARTWPDHHVTLCAVLPRRTVVVDAEGRRLCANADLVALVVAASARLDIDAVEDAVTRAATGGADPLVLVAEGDLAVVDGVLERQLAQRLPGTEVLVVSGRSGRGIAGLRDRLAGRLTLALVGPAGHGRSALVDALVGAGRLGDRRGVVPLPSGGAVVDTADLAWPRSSFSGPPPPSVEVAPSRRHR